MPGTVFHLVRHGAHDLLNRVLVGRGAVDLNAAGAAQATAIGAALAGTGLAAVISSPQARTQQTAAAIAQAARCPVTIDAAFDEIDMGEWTGADMAALHAEPRWHAFNRFRGSVPIPGGEAMLMVQARAVAGLLALRARHGEAALAVVSHADVLKALLMHFLGTPLDLVHRLDLPPGSRSVLELYDEGAVVRAMALPAS